VSSCIAPVGDWGVWAAQGAQGAQLERQARRAAYGWRSGARLRSGADVFYLGGVMVSDNGMSCVSGPCRLG